MYTTIIARIESAFPHDLVRDLRIEEDYDNECIVSFLLIDKYDRATRNRATYLKNVSYLLLDYAI